MKYITEVQVEDDRKIEFEIEAENHKEVIRKVRVDFPTQKILYVREARTRREVWNG